MHRINTNSASIQFLDKLTKPAHLYPTRFCQLNYTKPTHKLNRLKYRISIRGPYIWNEYLTKKEKEIKLTFNFKLVVKSTVAIKQQTVLFLKKEVLFPHSVSYKFLLSH